MKYLLNENIRINCIEKAKANRLKCFDNIIINLSKLIFNNNININYNINDIMNDISTSITKILPEALIVSRMHGNKYKESSRNLLFTISEMFIKRECFIKFLLLLIGGVTVNSENSKIRIATISSIGLIIHKFCKNNINIKNQMIFSGMVNNLFEIIINLIMNNCESEVFKVIIKLLKVIYTTFD